MKTSEQLRDMLQDIDHRPYPQYKSLKGEYRFPGYLLSIDHVQGDPFAAPSHLSIRMEHGICRFPKEYYEKEPARTALADYLLRQFHEKIRQFSFRAQGSGKSGLISVSACGQEILKRSALEITDREIIVRFHVGFPANGRTINARELDKILFTYLPQAAPGALLYKNQDAKKLERQIFLMEDQAFLREYLAQNGLAAFVADGSILPRESGISDRPMKGAIPFQAPDSLRICLNLPHRGEISGMGIKAGITLIVGGGYHGKSTLLEALQMGVYPHIVGDGREYVVTDPTAMKLRAEDGRFVKDVDVSLFIGSLPNGKDTKNFTTEDASGSTSQAAGLIEAIEAGSHLFLIDEDTSATNFMVRDALMQKVVAREKEPITPFLERAVDLYTNAGISTILVAGSSGAFFHIADTIIQMDNYRPVDITSKAKELARDFPLSGTQPSAFVLPKNRRVMTKDGAIHIRRDYYGNSTGRPEPLKIRTNGTDGFSIGRQDVDLRYVEQITDKEQMETLAQCLKTTVEKLVDGKRTVKDCADFLCRLLAEKGFAAISE
ncbi:MAG: ABC-ATPase domain-containing protein, partial [bacterium]